MVQTFLLGTPSTDQGNNIEIETVLRNLQIEYTEFTMEEYRVAKKQVNEGKAPGEENMMPELI